MLSQHRHITIYLFLLYFSTSSNCQRTVNKPCTVKSTGASGVCKVDKSCPKAKADAENGLPPTICEILVSSIYVVCCEGAQVTNVQASENSFVDADRNDNPIVFENENIRLPLSERKCLEYNKDNVERVEVIPLLSDPRPSGVLITKCKFDGLPLVIGGKPSLPGEFPFMAVLGYSTTDDSIKWNCGGTLISDFYVMTAAHCIITKFGRPVLVRLGELDLSKDDDNSLPEDFGVNDVRVHPDYNPISKNNDIAVIKLSKKVKFNEFIRPACLWNKQKIGPPSAIATGWGATETGGSTTDILQKVTLDLLDMSICDRTYGNIKYYKNGLPKTMLCAGILQGGKDTCQGDSGGPLTITKEDNQCIFYTVGITSFGRMCALENTPAIYTKVSEFIPWLQRIVWESES
ncbi:Trypsin [Oryctes borbonicus]|uniref:Trypsin n=1 Tax=Oryctes borbonicus TaxID=1629725 RepID=A0A0T6B1X0_9SCAR|nr:Trypsin [Oryctes borbonicus]